ncbi:MAG TPA: TAXI family TRAP transporter solute-binding subunit, partial [Candidatus Limnocylindria bacterium]|nr:TAXI family TRAP transporter solute-binding subunit [Candidatus Limnocylindria bacterium]
MLTDLAPPQIRGITGLELAAGVFGKCSDQLATQLHISLTSGKRDSGPMPLSIGINGDVYGGMRAPMEVGERRVDIAYVNPAALVAMAYRGKGYYKKKLDLRVLGCFPSWDRIALVVSKDLGVSSLRDIARRRIPLRVSTRMSGVNNGTYYTISTILSFYGLTFDHIRKWGGRVQECARPFAPERLTAIAKRSIDAVFDEGVSTPGGWLDQALGNGYEVIPIEPAIVKNLERLGYNRTVLPKRRYRQLKEDALTIDYSGWALVTHKWLPNDVAYAAVETIDERKKVIPVDDDRPLNMRNL